MSRWLSLIEKQLQQAVDEGQMSNLPGAGKPLDLDENPLAPADMRMAFKILQDNGYAPDWMMLGQEIDAKCSRAMAMIRRGVEAYEGSLQDATRHHTEAEQQRQRAYQAWDLAQKSLRDAVAKLNKEIMTYNLKVPQGVAHKPQLNLEQEIKRLLRQ